MGIAGAIEGLLKNQHKKLRGRLLIAAASPLLFDFVLPSGMGSSGIDLVELYSAELYHTG